MVCKLHPNNKAFYHDSKHKVDLCFGCVWDWLGKHRMPKNNESLEKGRITFSAPGYIDVGNFESGRDLGDNYSTVFNVSDNYSCHADFWIPLVEMSAWTYTPFYWFKKLADEHSKHPMLVHCHAGIHRSLLMAYCWLLSLGFDTKEAANLLSCDHVEDDYFRDIETGIIPGDLLDFYKIIEIHPKWCLSGVLRELGIPNLLNNTTLRKNTKYQDYLENTL